VKKTFILAALVIAAASMLTAQTFISKRAAEGDDHDHSRRFEFKPAPGASAAVSIPGTAATVTVGQTLPPGCRGGTGDPTSSGRRHDNGEGEMPTANADGDLSTSLTTMGLIAPLVLRPDLPA